MASDGKDWKGSEKIRYCRYSSAETKIFCFGEDQSASWVNIQRCVFGVCTFSAKTWIRRFFVTTLNFSLEMLMCRGFWFLFLLPILVALMLSNSVTGVVLASKSCCHCFSCWLYWSWCCHCRFCLSLCVCVFLLQSMYICYIIYTNRSYNNFICHAVLLLVSHFASLSSQYCFDEGNLRLE